MSHYSSQESDGKFVTTLHKDIGINVMTWGSDNGEELLPRFGQIRQVHPGLDKIQVDFDGNPAGTPIWASIGRAFTRSEINLAIDNQLDCKIEFLANDPSLPILTDIYFSVLEEKTMVIKANTLTLEGTQSLTLKSQQSSTHYNGRVGRITSKAAFITTEAEKLQKIQAKKIDLN